MALDEFVALERAHLNFAFEVKINGATERLSPVSQHVGLGYHLPVNGALAAAPDAGVAIALRDVEFWHRRLVVPSVHGEKVFIAMARANVDVHPVGKAFINLQEQFAKLGFYCFYVRRRGEKRYESWRTIRLVGNDFLKLMSDIHSAGFPSPSLARGTARWSS